MAIIPTEERSQYINSLAQADKTEDLTEFITYIAHCCKYALNLHLKAARGEDIEDVEDIDKEIAIFKRSLEKGTGNAIRAREYADQVLYPFFFYCKEKVERFSDLFESVHISGSFNVRGVDNQISSFSISEEKRDTWPENALSIDISIKFDLLAFQGKHNDDFVLQIKNETDAYECFWDFDGYFKSMLFKPAKINTGQGLKEIKKMFNELIRDMMKVLSEQSDN